MHVQLREANDAFRLKALRGQNVRTRGPTGKIIDGPLSEPAVVSLSNQQTSRDYPSLQATAVKAEVTTETIHTDLPEPRALARSIISILETAKLAEEPAAEPAGPSEPPGQLLLGRDEFIELNSNSGPSATVTLQGEVSVPISGSDASSNEPKHGETILLDGNGTKIVFDASRSKWQVFDVTGMEHHAKSSKEEAIAFAESLPTPSLMSHVGTDQPPEPTRTDYAAPVGRHDQRLLQPRGPQIIRRAPR
jgi:hypothetical protein